MHSIRRVIKPLSAADGKTQTVRDASGLPTSRSKRSRKARAPQRRTDETTTRLALLDAAEELLVEEGYAAVTSRRVAERAGTNAALIHYYFHSMDGLFVELFRRGAERGLQAQETALLSPQPLWALWEVLRDHLNNVRTVEFFALAHHREAVRTEVVEYSARYREMQLDVLSKVLAGYGLDIDTWPPVTLILAMGSISLLLLIEEGFGFTMGHADMVSIVERQIRELEGERWTGHPALAHRMT